MNEKNTLERSRQIFTEYLDRKGLRHTAERYMVLEVVNSLSEKFSVDMLCRAMQENNRHVAKATVYSTIRSLCTCGLVRELRDGGRERLYQYSAIPRINCVCRYCGKVREVKDSEVLSFITEKKFRGFRQEFYTITIHGLCTSCDRKTGANAKKRTTISNLSKTHKK